MKRSLAALGQLDWGDVTSSSIVRVAWRRSGEPAAEREELVENDQDEPLGSLFVEFQQGKTYHYADVWANLAGACKPCNSAKRDKPLLSWMATR